MKFKIWKSLGIALVSLPISAAWSVAGAEVVEYSFFGETLFGWGEECTFLPSVCALNGQGFLSGTVKYDSANLPIYPDTNYQPIFFEANWTGLANSLPWQPINFDINFSTESVTEFSKNPGLLDPPVLLASITDPLLPEFPRIDLRIQWDAPNHPPSFFSLSTPLSDGDRILSEGLLTMTKVTESEPVSVPEPASLLGLGLVVGLGTFGARKKHKSHSA